MRRSLLVVWLTIVVSCAPSRPTMNQSYYQSHQMLLTHMSNCTNLHGYNPDKTDGLGAHEVGQAERAWRSCMYFGVEAYIIPGTGVPKLYRRLIEKDRILTDQVERGEISRRERKAGIMEILELIQRKEEQQLAVQEQRLQALRDVVERRRRLAELRKVHARVLATRDSIASGL